MIIKKINIENFGKFSGRTFSFKPGFNLVFGKNEDGKSTIMSFIKMLFYGNSSSKSSDISKNNRKKYLPWSGASMSGSAELDINGENLLLHKEFKKSASSDKTTVTNLASGEKLDVSQSEEMGHYFFDMDLGEFERSVFIENYGGFSSDASADSLALRIANLSVSGDEGYSATTVRDRISSAREELVSKSGKKGLLVEEQAKLEQLMLQIEQLRIQKEAAFSLMAEISDLQKEISQMEFLLESHSAAQKAAVAKKDLATFTALMEKYDQLALIHERLKPYNLSESELKQTVSDCKDMKMLIMQSFSSVSPNNDAVISDSEFSRILEMEKQLSVLEDDYAYINGVIHRTRESLKSTISANRKKSKLITGISAGIAILSATSAIISFILSLPLFVPISCMAVFILCLILSLIFATKAKNLSNNVQIRLANQEFESALRLLSFYCDGISQKSHIELCGEYQTKKQDITNEINEKLNYYHCESVEELSSKTLSSQNTRFAAMNEAANKLKQQFIQKASSIQPVDSYEDAEALLADTEECLNRADTILHDIETLSKTIVTGRISPDFVKSQIVVLTKFIKESGNSSYPDDVDPQILKAELTHKRQKLGDLQSRVQLPETDESQLELQIADCKENIRSYSERYNILNIATDAMDAAESEMSKGLGSHLSLQTGKYLEMMSNGKYKDVIVSRDLNVETRSDNTQTFHEWKYMSSGAIDRVYLALRLATTDIIAENHNPLPLFLDDILTQYDDENCENTLRFIKKYLEESGSVSQIFFFTCHNHIADKAKTIFPDLSEITL